MTLKHETRNSLPAKTRELMAELLGDRLADILDLRGQLKQAHWNVKGPNFIGLHKLFDEIVEDVDDHADEIAERAVQLGAVVVGTVRAAARRSSLKEYPLDIAKGRDHVGAVADALAAFGRSARAAINAADEAGDKDTADLFTQVSRGIDKHLWMVEAHGQAEA